LQELKDESSSSQLNNNLLGFKQHVATNVCQSSTVQHITKDHSQSHRHRVSYNRKIENKTTFVSPIEKRVDERVNSTVRFLVGVFAFLMIFCPIVGGFGFRIGLIRFRNNGTFSDFVEDAFYSQSYNVRDDVPFWVLLSLIAFLLHHANMPGFCADFWKMVNCICCSCVSKS